MINIEKSKREFKKYVSNYDIKDRKIQVKIAHIERTANIAKKIAKSLNLSREDIELAELIGLLHDIGRFEQVKRYQTFVDRNSVNHGELGVKILFEEGIIRKFIENTQYDDIIKTSILNHNRNRNNLEFLNKKEEIHSKIIRDADKTDIIYVMTFEEKQVIWEKEDLSKEEMTDEIYQEFMKEEEIDYNKRKTSVDFLVSHFAFVYDFYYPYGLKIVKEKKYYDKIYQRFKFENKQTEKRMEDIYTKVKDFLENK